MRRISLLFLLWLLVAAASPRQLAAGDLFHRWRHCRCQPVVVWGSDALPVMAGPRFTSWPLAGPNVIISDPGLSVSPEVIVSGTWQPIVPTVVTRSAVWSTPQSVVAPLTSPRSYVGYPATPQQPAVVPPTVTTPARGETGTGVEPRKAQSPTQPSNTPRTIKGEVENFPAVPK